MQPITPHLWFDREAKEAAQFYCSVFPDSRITSSTVLYDTPSGECDLVSFRVWGQPFMAISAGPHFKINPSISFMVNFDPSREANAREMLDEAWNKLAEGGTPLMPLDKYPFSERYGWIQDKYGVSWQISSPLLDDAMINGTAEQKERFTKAFLQMKKFDLAELQKAYSGN